MKKKVIIALILLCFLLTGCQVDYKLEFRNDDLIENISISLASGEYNEENIAKMDYMGNNEAFAISERMTQKKYIYDRKNNIGYLNYTYNVDNFNRNNLFRQCYDSFNFFETEEGYKLVTSDNFKCGVFSYVPVNSYVITINTNRVVLEDNADRIDGNNYIWEIIPNNEVEIEKPIYIYFSNKLKSEVMADKFAENSKYVLIIILASLAILLVILVSIIWVKNKKNQS